MRSTLQPPSSGATSSRVAVSREQREHLHYLTVVCNRVACYVLHSAIDHVEKTPEAELARDRSFLSSLTAHEMEQEAILTAEVGQLYASFGSRTPLAHRAAPPTGGFDKSWTLAESTL